MAVFSANPLRLDLRTELARPRFTRYFPLVLLAISKGFAGHMLPPLPFFLRELILSRVAVFRYRPDVHTGCADAAAPKLASRDLC